MTEIPSTIPDEDLRHVGAALRRAAAKAKLLAIQTNTPFWVIKDGKLVDLLQERAEAAMPGSPKDSSSTD